MSSPKAVEGFNRSLAFLVAIDRYRNGVPELHTPVADATKLAGILEQHHGFKADVVANEEATLDKLREALADLRTRVGKDDRVLFYFAGHGIALDSDEGPRGFLLPQDAARDSADRYLPMVELNEALSALPCRHMLVILDCCFAGAFRWSSTRDLALAPENLHRERYAWYVHDAAWQAIASAAHDQKALDVAVGEALGERGQTAGHSPFAKALMEGLAGAADRRRADGTGDGVITATELFLHLEEELMPPPGSGRPRQTPILWPLPKHDKGQFVFLVPGKELDLPPAPPLNLEANPWRGLKPYESTHADLFFGRRGASERLLEQVLRHPLVVVTGASGIGKSSLVRAGLLPRLPVSIHPIVVRPGPAPFASLAAALREAAPDIPLDEDGLRTNAHSFAEWVRAQPAERQILLVIDQAEELITMNRDAEVTQQYLALIDNALNADERLRIVVTIRSEFEPQFARSPLKNRWLGARYLVPQMTQDELRRVIEGPATVKVMRFESADLVDTLVNEVVQMPGALPLLSFALSEMYSNYLRRPADDRTLTNEHYEALQGGVTGSLRVRANRLIDDLNEAHQLTARRVLERLVSVESGQFARRRVPRRELEVGDAIENERVGKVLNRLDEARLIVTDEGQNEPYLELAHDALILGWDRLLGWVREDLERIIALRRLTPDAEEWVQSKRRKKGLLWDDGERAPVLQALNKERSPGLNAFESDFAAASLRRMRWNSGLRALVTLVLIFTSAGAMWAAFSAETRRAEAQLSLAEAQIREAHIAPVIATISGAATYPALFDSNIVRRVKSSLLSLVHRSTSALVKSDETSYSDGPILQSDPNRTLLVRRSFDSSSEIINFDSSSFKVAKANQECSMVPITGVIACEAEDSRSISEENGLYTIKLPASEWSNKVAVSALQDRIAIIRDGILTTYNKSKFEKIDTMPAEECREYCTIFYRSGGQIVLISQKNDVFEIDVSTKSTRNVYKNKSHYYDQKFEINQNGTAILLGEDSSTVLVLLGASSKHQAFDKHTEPWKIPRAALSPSHERAVGVVDGRLTLIDTSSGQMLTMLDTSPESGVRFSPDGKMLIVVEISSPVAYVFESETGRLLSKFSLTLRSDLEKDNSARKIVAMDICISATCLAILDEMGRLQIFDIRSGARIIKFEVPLMSNSEIILSNDASYLALSGVLQESTVFNQGTGAVHFYRIAISTSATPLAHYQDSSACTAVANNGIAVAVNDCRTRSYKLFSDSGRKMDVLKDGKDEPDESPFITFGSGPIAFSSDSRLVATVDDLSMLVWTVADARVTLRLSGPFRDRRIMKLKFMDRFGVLLALDELGYLSAYDMVSGSELIVELSEPVSDILSTPVGDIIVCRGIGGRVFSLNRSNNSLITTYIKSDDFEISRGIALDPSGEYIAHITAHKEIAVKSVRTGRDAVRPIPLPEALDVSALKIDMRSGGRQILLWQQNTAPMLIDLDREPSPLQLKLPKFRNAGEIRVAGFNKDGDLVALFDTGVIAFWLNGATEPEAIQPVYLGLADGNFDPHRTVLLVRGSLGYSGEFSAFLLPISTDIFKLLEVAQSRISTPASREHNTVN